MKYPTWAFAFFLLAFSHSSSTLFANNKMNSTMQNTSITMAADPDQAAIEKVLQTMFTAVDQRDWATVKSTMADSVYINYSALGGEQAFKQPNEIIASWKGLLPGFERTIHQPHNFAVWVAGDRASATLDAIATHFLQTESGANFWTVFVGYDTEFIKQGDHWKLARIDVSLYQQAGNTGLPQLAIKNLQAGNIPALATESKGTQSVERFFDALEKNRLEDFLDNLSKEIIQNMPLAPNSFPRQLAGKDAMRQQYRGVMDYEQRYERTYYPTQDPHTVLVKFNGTITTSEGKPYNNYYIGIYQIDEQGKIKHFVEHFNPNILLNGWPGLSPETYSVHAAGARRNSGITMQPVNFHSQGVQLAGHLFLPPGFDSSATYPSAIVTGSWTSVKEQMPDEYASLLAQNGFIALTFDFTGFGESEGQPRQVEDYQLKINDIRAAVDFLSAHPNVDLDQLSGLGVCASSGYMAHAAAQDDRIKKLALVAPWLHNPAIAKSIYDMRPGGTEGLIAAAKKAKERYATTGEMEYVLAASELDPLSAMYVPGDIFDYYLNPAKAAGNIYDNRFAISSWEPWLSFDGISSAGAIEQPVFIVHSESGAVPQGAKAFYEQLASEKSIIWLNEYNQQQLYHEKEAVDAAIGAVVDYLK
jgi:hypothetical protein